MGTCEVTVTVLHGSARVAGVLVSPIPPYLQQADNNPEGCPSSLFEGFILPRPPKPPPFLMGFLDNFCDVGHPRHLSATRRCRPASTWRRRSAIAAMECIPPGRPTSAADLATFDVPVLVVQGDPDRILPFHFTGDDCPRLIKATSLVVIEGGPHPIAWTHADQVNRALYQFLSLTACGSPARPGAGTAAVHRWPHSQPGRSPAASGVEAHTPIAARSGWWWC